jgi:hygromycin-B 4-O-kinase
VQAFLSARLGERIGDLEAVGEGEWSKAFTFRVGTADYVVRFSRLDEDFFKDRRAMAFASAALPIPRLVEVGEAFEGFFALSERAFGTYMDILDDSDMRRLLPSLFAALDGAREADVSDSTGFGIWRADGNAPHRTWREALLDIANDRPTNRTHGWRARLEASSIGAEPFDECFTRLRALIEACPEARHLVHSDLLHFNVLVDADRITAVFDWGSSLYGDFVFDVAWFTFWQPWYPAWSSIDFAAEAERHYAAIGLDVPGFRERLRCYELYIGLDGMAYQAFVGRFTDVEQTARRTLAVVRG